MKIGNPLVFFILPKLNQPVSTMKTTAFVIAAILLLSCRDNEIDGKLIHKLWLFQRYDTRTPKAPKPMFADNGDKKIISLDLRRPDTLFFNTIGHSVSVAYEIEGDHLVLKYPHGDVKQKIWQLTGDKLMLGISEMLRDAHGKPLGNTYVMIYKAQQP